MATPVPVALAHRDDRDVVRHDHDVDHNFLPDFSWAGVGGGAALAVCALILILTASLGGGSPISAYARELAGAFLAGFLVVLVARSLTARSR
jgi:hypothetical protein